MYRTERIGIPLRLAYGMTIHMVQGLTCENLIFNTRSLPTSAFAYVGLSRVIHRDAIIFTYSLELKHNQQAQVENKSFRMSHLDNECAHESSELIRKTTRIALIHNSTLKPR